MYSLRKWQKKKKKDTFKSYYSQYIDLDFSFFNKKKDDSCPESPGDNT